MNKSKIAKTLGGIVVGAIASVIINKSIGNTEPEKYSDPWFDSRTKEELLKERER